VKAPPGSPTPSYDGEIAYVDRALGAFLSSLTDEARWRGMLTVLTSDHGEGLGEHREKTHGVFVYESTLRVPLIFHWPGVLSPRRVRAPVDIVDTAPTILELVQLPGLPDVDGQSLVPLMQQPGSDEAERVFYFESLLGALDYGWAPLRGIRSGNLKYISAPRPELYDLRADPRELNNLYATRAADAARLAEYLSAIGEGDQATAEVDPRTRAGLEALGYVSAPPVTADAQTERADPKDHIEVYDRFQSAHTEFALGRSAEALAIMEALEPSLQRSPVFYNRWGTFAGQAGSWQRAALSYEKCLALDPGRETARLNLGVAYLKCNRFAESLEQLEILLRVNPDQVQALLYAGELNKTYLGKPAEALPHWRRFLELAPNHPDAGKIRKAVSELSDE
jgi:tetratricopeptide (TPR) repeat protein